jgi:hypothetical protein
MSSPSFVGFVYRNDTDKLVFKICTYKKPKPPEDFVVLKEVLFFCDFDTSTEQMQKVIADMLDSEKDPEHFYGVIVRENNDLRLDFCKSQKEFENKNVLEYRIFQKAFSKNAKFPETQEEIFEAQSFLDAQTWFANKKPKLFYAKAKNNIAPKCIVDDDPYIPNKSLIIPKQMKFEPSDLVRHWDSQGHEHIGIVLAVYEDSCKLAFLSTHPEWSLFYRAISEKERHAIESCLFGKVKDTSKQSYLASVERDIPNADLVLLSKGFPMEIFEKIAIEFNKKCNENYQGVAQ